ncbi:hypothetical protein J6P51_01120 [bacterium]|nr:hypothetical protein [bacterium]MBO6022609.1 hypothetical protein [bacterium]
MKLINVLKNIFDPIAKNLEEEDLYNKKLNEVIFNNNFDKIGFYYN